MNTENTSSIVPAHISGDMLDIEHHVVEDSIEKAIKTFERAASRLVNPPVWHLLAGELSAKFSLFSPENLDNKRLARINDYFSIDIPGPGPVTGDGLDWVQVEALEENNEPGCDASIAMKLRPSNNPLKPGAGVAHFFTEDATSSFIIKRIGFKVVASYHGRNEMANTADGRLMDKLRNKVVAIGAKTAFSYLQWGALNKRFLEAEIGG